MRELRAAVEIDAPPHLVWDTITEFQSFPAWNPFIRKATGRLTRGARLAVTLQLGRWRVTLHPRLTVVDAPRELRWLARPGVPGVLDVDRRFLLEPITPYRCRFVQSETARGLLAPLLLPLVGRQILHGYRQLNTALKTRVEQAR